MYWYRGRRRTLGFVMGWIDEHEDAQYTLVESLAAHGLCAASLGALSCCSTSLQQCTATLRMSAKKEVASYLAQKLQEEHAWFKSALVGGRSGAPSKMSINGEALTGLELPAWLRFVAVTGSVELKLRNNFLGRVGCRCIADAGVRGVLDTLHSLVLSHNFIDDEGLESLADGIARRGFSQLRTLNLSHNYVGDRGLKHLVAAFCERGALPLLTCLRIAGHENVSELGVKALASALAHGGALPSLNTLVVSRGHERNTSLVAACRGRRVKLL